MSTNKKNVLLTGRKTLYIIMKYTKLIRKKNLVYLHEYDHLHIGYNF